MSPIRKQGAKRKPAGKPIVLPSAFAPRSPGSETLLSPDQASQIQQLADLLKRNHLTDLEIERSGTRIRITHEPAVRTAPQAAETSLCQTTAAGTAPSAQAMLGRHQGRSRSVPSGTFYRSPSPMRILRRRG